MDGVIVSYEIKELLRELRDEVGKLDSRVDQIEYWRWRIAGGLGVAGLFFGLASALFVWIVTR